jgi:hypothetical protein
MAGRAAPAPDRRPGIGRSIAGRNLGKLMKIDLAVMSAMFDELVPRGGEMPYRQLKQRWGGVRLRESDLTAVIEHLWAQGRLGVETRRDGIWLRRNDFPGAPRGLRTRLRVRWRRFIVGLAVEQVRERRETFYAGAERRLEP